MIALRQSMSSNNRGSHRAGIQQLALGLGLGAVLALPAAAQPAGSATDAQRAKSSVVAKAKPPAGGPAWSELTASQKAALAPLSSSWTGMSEGHKRKWIALSANHANLQPAEQAKLHERMTEWSALSPQQRAQARLNFGQAQSVPAEEKKAKWDAYQALSPEERKSLAEKGRQRPAGAAPAVRPVAAQKLATVPAVQAGTRHPSKIGGASGDGTAAAPATPADPHAPAVPGQ